MNKIRILILAYDFPPYNSIAAQRPASWVKYLSDFNIQPTVITLHWDNRIFKDQDYIIPSFNSSTVIKEDENARVIRVPFRPTLRDRILYKYGFNRFALIRKLLTIYSYTTKYALLWQDNTREIYRQAKDELSINSYDLIIATAEPFVLFKYAHHLSSLYKIPWIADYRDAWTNNPVYDGASLFFKAINYKYFRRLEKKYVSTASYVTTPSPSYSDLIKNILPQQKFEVIYNGNDISDNGEHEDISQSYNVFEIAYAGRIYPHQNLEIFLEAYKRFIDHFEDQIEAKLIFYGLKFYHDNVERVLNYNKNLNSKIELTDRIPYEQLISKLKRANLLLLLSSSGANWLNAKIFDYLPLNRKIILATDDKGILKEILEECHGGEAFDTVEQIKNKLIEYYQEFKATGLVQHTPNDNITKYTRKVQTQRFAKLITKCVE